jgi:tetratricopeptide (TPR) repeat protein
MSDYPRIRALRALAVTLAVLAAVAVAPCRAAAAPQNGAAELAAVQELLDAERPEEALARLEPILARNPDQAGALLARGTARLMLGQVEGGRHDLERSLALDPEARRGWLTLAGLEVAEERYDRALAAFRRAEQLDPRALDNDLNIGAVLLIQGQLRPASERFAAYLSEAGDSADAAYLVATNYALAGYAALAIQHLRRAAELDERSRLRARSDPNFRDLLASSGFAELMATDTYRPPEGAYTAARTFATRYRPDGSGLLAAVIEALQIAGTSFDPRVEVSDRWALIWGDVRIKVTNTVGGQGLVQLSAPADRMTPGERSGRTERLFRDVTARLTIHELTN